MEVHYIGGPMDGKYLPMEDPPDVIEVPIMEGQELVTYRYKHFEGSDWVYEE